MKKNKKSCREKKDSFDDERGAEKGPYHASCVAYYYYYYYYVISK